MKSLVTKPAIRVEDLRVQFPIRGGFLRRPTGAIRAVGSACGANPTAVIVPCHRVIGANGSLTGYAGGLPRKEKLLQHEGVLLT